jgi:hypothetical protein
MAIFTKIPTDIIINEEVYEILLVKKPGNKKNLDGIIFYNDNIQIDSSLPRDGLESTLIHELLHGISRHYALRLCETTIQKLEQGLFDLFKKNEWKIVVK